MMKLLLLLASLALGASTLVDAAAEGHARVHIHQAKANAAVREREVDQAHVEERVKMFEHVANMKETPWDSDEDEKQAKCDDFCLLLDFWNFQMQRNCVNRPTGLCSPYKMGIAGLDSVILVADCDCNSTASGSASASVGDDA